MIITPSVTLQEAQHSERSISPSITAVVPPNRNSSTPSVRSESPTPVGTTAKAKPAPSKPVTIAVPHRRSNPTASEATGQHPSTPKDNPKDSVATGSKPPVKKPPVPVPVPVIESSEYTYDTSSSSSEDSSGSKKDAEVPAGNTLVIQPESVSLLKGQSKMELQARVLLSKACDQRISTKQFIDYLDKAGLRIFNPGLCTEEHPFRCVAIFGPPKIGKSTLGSAMNLFIQGTPQTTTSKKFYKYVNEAENVNLFHYTNDSFSSSDGIDWGRLTQSINSTKYQPGRHFIVLEGHRLFESPETMALADHVIILTGSQYSLRNRKVPTPELSFQLYCDRIRPYLAELNASKTILKLDARNSADTMVKKVGAFLAMSNLGYPSCGRQMSDTKALLETN